jgi:beta-lysine 5,6-aminomutase beta subunit
MSRQHRAEPGIRPYGDTVDDGMIQVSFTLPMPHDERAENAALQLARAMGIERPLLVHATTVGLDFSFFVIYGATVHRVDLDAVPVVERTYPLLSPKEVDAAISNSLGRRLVVVGGCIGTDAHTVGIDAILNIKGFAGRKGLEHHRQMKVVNLGAQVEVDVLVRRARAEEADAVLVSQVVTQRDAHLFNVRELSAALGVEFTDRDRPLLVVGGPRFEVAEAVEAGADHVFGRGTTPDMVASYLVHVVSARRRTSVAGVGVPR